MKTLILNNGLVYVDGQLRKRSIFIRGHKITFIRESAFIPSKKENITILNCQSKWILPGLIDPHVHFRVPGAPHKEDWLTGSQAALAGGVTTVLDMPNTNPPTTTQERLEEKKTLVQKSCWINFGFHVGACSSNIETLHNMHSFASVKIYFGSSTGNLLFNNLDSLKKHIFKVKQPFAFHAEKESLIQENLKKGIDLNHYKAHGQIRNTKVAVSAVQEILKFFENSSSKLYFCHISTKQEFLAIQKAKKKQPIFCEITPHHLFLNETAYQKNHHFAKVNPPLRDESNRNFLYQALPKNKIDVVATDHAPHLKSEKKQPYTKAPSGVPGLETMLPLLLNEITKKHLTIQQVIQLTCENPASFFNIKNKGKIQPSYDADLTIILPHVQQTLGTEGFYTKCNWSPFQGQRVSGLIETTIVLGNIVYHKKRFFPTLGKAVEYENL